MALAGSSGKAADSARQAADQRPAAAGRRPAAAGWRLAAAPAEGQAENSQTTLLDNVGSKRLGKVGPVLTDQPDLGREGTD